MIPVTAVERSGDTKLSVNKNVSATWASQVSCSTDCPLQKNGCYAELGHAAITTGRMNKLAKVSRLTLSKLKIAMARQEARLINALTATRKLRVHVVGDCSTKETAGIIGRAMRRYEAKFGKAAWTYTHSWRHVPYAAWKGARVLASCESPAQVRETWRQGYQGVALIVPPHPTHKTYGHGGVTVIPCPAQFKAPDGGRRTTCEHCRICQDIHRLGPQGRVVGFAPDYGSDKKVLRVLQGETRTT